MADPLSIAASVAGLVTLAASTAKLAKTMSDRYNEKAAASIQNDIEMLDAALVRITESLGHHSFNGIGEEALKHPVELCTRTLREIERQFQKLDVKGVSIKSLTGRLARPEILREIQKLQTILEGQKITILMAMQTCSGQNQSNMLNMIFGAINDLKAKVDQERITKGICGHGAFSTQATLNNTQIPSSESVVHTHPSFEDWLATWTVIDGDQGSLPLPPVSKPPQSAMKTPQTPPASSASGNVKLIIEGVHELGTATKEITMTSNDSLCDIILHLEEEARNIRNPQPDSSAGRRKICGFTIADNEIKVSPFMPKNTSLVIVTDEASCYDVQAGLKINRQEPMIEFYNECVRRLLSPANVQCPLVEKRQSGILVRNPRDASCSSTITFQRTLRVPEDMGFRSQMSESFDMWSPNISHAYGTSELLGPFPIFNTEEYRARLPQEMGAKGGLFFPIFQREAFAISFKDANHSDEYALGGNDDEHFAIRIRAGGINCVSKISSNGREYDYVVCPKQRRVDGYMSSHDKVRQFVAMPIGWEYSAEYQISGAEMIGGLQLQIAPSLCDTVKFRSHDNLWNMASCLNHASTASEIGLETGAAIAMSNLDKDVELVSESERTSDTLTRWQAYQSSHPILYAMETGAPQRVTTVQDILQIQGSRDADSKSVIRLRPILSMTVRLNIIVKHKRSETAGDNVSALFDCSPFLDLMVLISKCLHGHGINCGCCDKACCTRHAKEYCWAIKVPGKMPFYPSIDSYYRLDDTRFSPSVDELEINCTRHHSIHHRPGRRGRRRAKAAKRPPSGNWDMALGAGAHLLQKVHEGRSNRGWDWRNSCVINIQFLNAAAFKSVTGIPAWTPVSLMNYQRQQLTLHIPFEQGLQHKSAVQSTIPSLRYIGEIDMLLSDDDRKTRSIVVCPQCESNLCNISLLPCKHVICGDCNTDSPNTCFQCGGDVLDRVVFSAVMPASFRGKHSAGLPFTLEEARREFEVVPGYQNSRSHEEYESAEHTAAALSTLNLGDQEHFWFNSIISVLKKTEKRAGTGLVKALVVEKALRGAVYHLEALLPLLSRIDFFEDEHAGRAQLRNLLQASLETINTDMDESDDLASTTTCLEAVIDWMESESIEPDHLLDWRTDLRPWLRPQTPQSLKRVVGFLTRGGKPLTEYGFDMGRLIGTDQKTPDLQIEKILLQDFISHGFDVNCRDVNGRTLIWYPLDILPILLDNGALMDIYDNNGNTVLHSMVLQGNKEHLANLLRHEKSRVAVNVRNKDHLTPYHLALGIDDIYTWIGLTDLMRDSGADVNLPIPDGPYRDGLAHSIARWEAALGNTVFFGPSALQRLQTVREALAVPPALSLTHVAAGGIYWTQA